MATVLIALAAAVVLAVLAVLVATLLSRVRRLDAELERLRAAAPPQRQAAVGQPTAEPAAVGRQPNDDAVAVITGVRADRQPDLPEPSLGRVVSATMAEPMIRVAALSHGLRRALDEESRMRIAFAFRKELRRQRRLQRQHSGSGRP
ncbi:MAG: hypothetical protein ACR2JU_16835 [Nocardioidaceae bacterium]